MLMSFHPFTRYKPSALSLHLHFPTPGCFSSGRTQAQPSAEQEFALTVRMLRYQQLGNTQLSTTRVPP